MAGVRVSAAEEQLALQIRAVCLPEPVREYRFHDVRKWRLDFAWPDYRFAVEVEGGGWVGGRHTRGAGFEADMVKYQTAMLDGWTVYRCSPGLVKSGDAVKTIETMLAMLAKGEG